MLMEKNCQQWKQEWHGDFYHINGTTNSNGLIILINKNFPHDNLKEIKINNRCLGISLIHNDRHVVIFNIYAPAAKEERTAFLDSLPELSDFFSPDSLVIVNGDFNMLLKYDPQANHS